MPEVTERRPMNNEYVKFVQSTLSHLQSPLNKCSPSTIMALSCENDIFMARSYKQRLPKIAQDRPIGNRQCLIRAICYFQIINIQQGEATARCLGHVANVHI